MLTFHCMRLPLRIAATLGAGLMMGAVASQAADQEWTTYGGGLDSRHYSPLDIVTAENFNSLSLAWSFDTSNFGDRPEAIFQSTPLVADGVMYSTVGSRRDVVALNAETGELLWMFRLDEGARGAGAPRTLSGRGLSYMKEGDEPARILYVTPGYRLIALDATSGARIPDFGDNGMVDLKREMDQELDLVSGEVGLHAAPVVHDGVIVIGSAFLTGSAPSTYDKPKGTVRGYDARTGKRLWIFHPVPQGDAFGSDTWRNDSWAYNGYTGVWAQMTIDEELDILYLPVEMPTGDYYRGHCPGDNLFANSLVALDLHTGERLWHFQTIHHDIWDWDLPSAPILADLSIAGEKRKAVVQPTKQGFVFVFDRVTGEALFDIEERPVPQTDVPGEVTSPTQPFPVAPPPFEKQGLTVDDLIDFTPQMRAEAEAIVAQHRVGPLYTPPSLAEAADGTFGYLQVPSATGGSNWPGGAIDPETGLFYIFTKTEVTRLSLSKQSRSTMDWVNQAARGAPRLQVQGLPLMKPPYGRIVALDMNKGEIVWEAVHGETPVAIRNHPALKGMDIPKTGQAGRVGTLVTKTLLIAGDGGGFTHEDGKYTAYLRAYDKATGEEVGALRLPAEQSGTPMTYSLGDTQYVAVAVSGRGITGGRLMVFKMKR